MDSTTESFDSSIDCYEGECMIDMEENLHDYMMNWLNSEGKKLLLEYATESVRIENKKLEEEKLRLQEKLKEIPKANLKSIPLIEIPDIGSPKKEKSSISRLPLKKYKRNVTPSKFEK